MAYTPNEWACGDTLTAEKLNNIERGISEMNSEYVPTEWQCGDTITAEKLNKIEQGIANAGGGSSDFSTATVTLESSSEFVEGVMLSYIQDDGVWVTDSPDTGVHTVPLFNGINNVLLLSLDMNVNVSGSAEKRGAQVRVTGDCTITISDGGGIDDHPNA